MLHRKPVVVAVGAALAAAAFAFAPAAKAGSHVGFNVSIGGPGYAVSVGNAPYYGGYRHGYRGHRYYRPAPVYVAPPVVYRPAPVYYAPAPVYYPAPAPVYGGPVYYRY
jgi:hypothetical protein